MPEIYLTDCINKKWKEINIEVCFYTMVRDFDKLKDFNVLCPEMQQMVFEEKRKIEAKLSKKIEVEDMTKKTKIYLYKY